MITLNGAEEVPLDHAQDLYAADEVEATAVGNSADYVYERIEEYIYSTAQPGTSLLHRLFHPRPDHVLASHNPEPNTQSKQNLQNTLLANAGQIYK